MKEKQKKESNNNSSDMFRYFNDAWNTESPTDDDEGLTISDEDGYEDGIDSFPTKKKTTIEDSYEEYGN